MSLIVTDSESILDVDGIVIGADAATLLKSIDRLMTVGTYYSLEHDQYVKASEKACAAMVAAIRPRRSLAIEIAAAGLVIDGHTLDPRLRVVRQIHELLVALNVAHLEIAAELTATDLRRALAALHEHRLALGQSQTFHEIKIENLPPTVSLASRRVGAGGVDQLLSPDDILEAIGESQPTIAGGAATTDPAAYLREFMELLRQAQANLASAPPAAGNRAERLTPSRDELAAFREGLQRLLAHRPDAANLTRLMSLAREAAAVSADAAKARLLFEHVRQTVVADPAPPESVVSLEPVFVEGTDTVEALSAQLVELATRPEPLAEPGPTERCDQLALGFRLLAVGVHEHTAENVLEALRATCRDPDLGEAEARVIAASLTSLATAGRSDRIDTAACLLAELRRAHPALVATVWSSIDPNLEPAALAALWPHLVNDLLLGLAPAPDAVVAQLCLLAGGLAVESALEQAERLASLPGALSDAAADDLFHVPPPRMRCVHAALMQSRAAERHGPRLHRALARRPLDPLTGVLMSAVGSYGPQTRPLFLALLRDGGREPWSPQVRALSSALLTAALADLPRAARTGSWAPEAIAWLGRLAPVAAQPLLRRIVTERRWLWRRAWPDACRAAAAAALADHAGES